MLRFTALFILAVFTASCSSKVKLERYETDINNIRNEVRSIRMMTDEMRNELLSMRSAVQEADENIKRQSEDIELQRQHQAKLREMVDSVKDSVVKLESETLPAKKEELRRFEPAGDDSGFNIRTEQENGITKVYAEKLPEYPDVKVKKPKPAEELFKVEQEINGFGYAVKDGVILWQYPTKSADVLEILVSWQQLSILGRIKNDGLEWWKVKTKEHTGFVNSRFIIISE